MKTIIMAGGKGTRISNLFPNIPKPLIPLKDKNGIEKPVLEWELLSLRDQGFKDVLITVSYMADVIQSYFLDGSKLGIRINYFVEESPLGNAGALYKIREWIGNEPFLLLNADSVFDVDFNRLINFHHDKGGLVTLFTHPNSHPYDSGLIIADDNNQVISWLTKEESRPQWYKNRVNAGLHVINPKVLDMVGINPTDVGPNNRVDLDRQILKKLCNSGRMFVYDSPEYVKDMGTPERYLQVSRDFESGVVKSKNLSNMQKAIFLDRDGTINKYVGFLRDIDQFELVSGAADAIRKINNSGYLAIVVTNQPVIARGELSYEELDTIHNKMQTLLGNSGAYIDAIYYCPHHPDKGFEGEIVSLKIDCDCRKPKPGLLLKAASNYNIDLKSSWMIGDGKNDVLAGKAAGCKTVLIGYDDFGQDITSDSLLQSIDAIIS